MSSMWDCVLHPSTFNILRIFKLNTIHKYYTYYTEDSAASDMRRHKMCCTSPCYGGLSSKLVKRVL